LDRWAPISVVFSMWKDLRAMTLILAS
jgi:hypothetical protein